MIERLFVSIWTWGVFFRNKNRLPTESEMINPKMHYDGLSGSFFWEDEGLDKAPIQLIQAFKFVTAHRTQLMLGPEYDGEFLQSRKFDKRIFKMARKYFPGWIGFDQSRCSYDPERAERMIRIIKVADWRLEKLSNEEY